MTEKIGVYMLPGLRGDLKREGKRIIPEERQARLALALNSGVGPVRSKLLLDYFESAREILTAPLAKVRETGRLSSDVKWDPDQALDRAEQEMERLKALGGWAVVLGDREYPPLLREIPVPPLALFGLGGLEPGDSQAVAIVGSRQATHYGRKITFRLAQEMAGLGLTVVSGMAVGVDAAAHRGALDGGGRTIAVLGCGLDVNYPVPNQKLKAEIIKSGAVLSEYPLGTEPRAGTFPVRNRIIAGMCKGVVVAEGSPRSGSLITADHALEYGRTIMAVPGPVFDRRREGPHNLIRQGATLVSCGAEVVEELWPDADRVKPGQMTLFGDDSLPGPNPVDGLEPDAAKVFGQLEANPIHADELIRAVGLPPQQTQVILLDLEMMGLVRRLPGQLFVRN